MNGLAVAAVVGSLMASMACSGGSGQAATPSPTAPGSLSGQTSGFFTNGPVQLSYRLDVPAHTAPVGAVVFGHGSGLQTKSSCRFLADGFLARGYATLCFDKRGVGKSTGQFINLAPQEQRRGFRGSRRRYGRGRGVPRSPTSGGHDIAQRGRRSAPEVMHERL